MQSGTAKKRGYAHLQARVLAFFRSDPKCLSQEQFGVWAERRAVRYLKRRGFRILSRNYRTPMGEIDIVAGEDEWLVFVEVKGERCLTGQPDRKVTSGKRHRLIRAAKSYISRYRLRNRPARFDVVTVQAGADGKVRVEHQSSAFQAT